MAVDPDDLVPDPVLVAEHRPDALLAGLPGHRLAGQLRSEEHFASWPPISAVASRPCAAGSPTTWSIAARRKGRPQTNGPGCANSSLRTHASANSGGEILQKAPIRGSRG